MNTGVGGNQSDSVGRRRTPTSAEVAAVRDRLCIMEGDLASATTQFQVESTSRPFQDHFASHEGATTNRTSINPSDVPTNLPYSFNSTSIPPPIVQVTPSQDHSPQGRADGGQEQFLLQYSTADQRARGPLQTAIGGQGGVSLQPSLTSQSAPVTLPYQSLRLPQNQGYLPPPVGQPFQPFAGIGALAPPQSTQHVNRARLGSAAATLPTSRGNTTLPRRRGRGRAQRPPALHTVGAACEAPPTIEDCNVVGAQVPTARVTVRVYPPKVSFIKLIE